MLCIRDYQEADREVVALPLILVLTTGVPWEGGGDGDLHDYLQAV